ncbi:MAG: hypothetical protein QW063_02335 [Candidatus Nanoarchaeia archaeon]
MMTKLFALLATLLLIAPLGAFTATATDGKFTITDVDYEDPVAPGTSVAVTVTLENTDAKYDVEDIVVKVWIENQFNERITEKALVSGLQVQQNDERDLTLTVQVPEDAEEGDYTLVVTANGRWEKTGEQVSARYEDAIEIERNDDALFISKIELFKEKYKAAEAVDVAVTVYNNGNEDQNDVIVAISVPELGIQKSIKLFGTFFAGTEQTVYFTFKLPENIDAGIYTIKATVSNALAKYSTSINLFVESAAKIDTNKISTSTISKELKVNEDLELQLKVANGATESKDYFVSVKSTDGLVCEVTPNSFTLKPGESKLVNVLLVAKAAGEQTAKITINENGNVISVAEVEVNVKEALSGIAALFLFLVLILVGVVIYLQYKGKQQKMLYY